MRCRGQKGCSQGPDGDVSPRAPCSGSGRGWAQARAGDLALGVVTGSSVSIRRDFWPPRTFHTGMSCLSRRECLLPSPTPARLEGRGGGIPALPSSGCHGPGAGRGRGSRRGVLTEGTGSPQRPRSPDASLGLACLANAQFTGTAAPQTGHVVWGAAWADISSALATCPRECPPPCGHRKGLDGELGSPGSG